MRSLWILTALTGCAALALGACTGKPDLFGGSGVGASFHATGTISSTNSAAGGGGIGGSGGANGGAGGGAGAVAGASAGGAGGGVGCALVPGDSACRKCLKQSCCSDIEACLGEALCTCWYACYDGPGSEGPCFTSCGGWSDLWTNLYYVCGATSCIGVGC